MIFGERLKEARELVGLTQAELAADTGVDRSAIAHVESGRQQLGRPALDALAYRLGFPPSFFEDDQAVEFSAGSLLFRARAISAKERAQAHRYGELVYRKVRPLLDGRRVPPVTLPRLAGASPEVAAAHTRAALGLSPDGPIPHLINAVERAGVLVIAVPQDLPKRDAYSLWAGEESLKPIVVLLGEPPGDRLRFNVGHELGHVVMGDLRSASTREIERRANDFAGHLLYPRAAAEAEITTPVTLGSLAGLKVRRGMSIQALVTHARRIDLVTERQARYLYQQINQRGWKRREPSNLDVPREKPRAVRKVLESAFGTPIDYRRAGDELRLYPHFLRRIVEAHASLTELPRPDHDRPPKVIPIRRSGTRVPEEA